MGCRREIPNAIAEFENERTHIACRRTYRFQRHSCCRIGNGFANPTVGEWTYEMSRADAKEWFDDASLGGFFNDNIR
jgi:hypothetical protein